VKVCCTCHKPRDIKDFHKHPLSPDGRAYECKLCKYKYNKARREANPQAIARYMKAYRPRYYAANIAYYNEHGKPKKPYPKIRICPKCKQPRFREEYFVAKRELSGREIYCMYCSMNSRARRYWQDVHGQRARVRSWYLLRGKYLRDDPHQRGLQRKMNITWKSNAELRQRNL
jgi:rubredoxin